MGIPRGGGGDFSLSVSLSLSNKYMYPVAKVSLSKKTKKSKTADGIMAMSLGSHVVDHGLSPGPGGLNSCWACVCVCPRFQEENRGEGIVAWPSPLGGDFSLSVSLSLSVFLVSAHGL